MTSNSYLLPKFLFLLLQKHNNITQRYLVMSELSKFIHLLVEYEEKIEGHLNKKYKPFLRKMLNQDQLLKTVSPDHIYLSKELIVFKLGLQAKSSKAIEISLNYLKLFQLKFIDLNQPNYCEHFSIEQTGVKEVSKQPPKTQVRQQLISLIKQNLHYKNNEINLFIVKVLQFLITEPILDLILDITTEFPHDSTSILLFNYFSFRFHVYEEICYYSQAQINTFTTFPLRTQKIQKQIKRAQQENVMLQDLIGRYMQEYLSIIDGSGGRYGRCVMCGQPAQHYCKITKASLCGMDCKKKHIDLAQKQYRHQFQATHLWQAIYSCFKELLVFLQNNESPLVFSVLSNLLEKPYLFMIVKKQFRKLIGQYVKPIFNKVLLYRQQNSFEHIYYFMASLTKNWLYDCLNQVQYFFKEYVLKVLEEKKPTFRFINLVFKALAKIFQYGKITVQLYINFDCQINRQNVIEKILFQLAKIAQDRFWPANTFSKTEKASIKNHSLSLLLILAMGLNEYRKTEPLIVDTGEVIALKQRKMSLEQFVVRFNEHWTNGLKTLFNLNLVGLDSNQQIVDIFMTLKGLNKEVISEYFSCQKGFELFEIFLIKIVKKHPENIFLTLLQLHHYIPLKSHSICLKKLIQYYKDHCQKEIEKEASVYLDFLCKNFNIQDLKKFIATRKQIQIQSLTIQKLYVLAIEAKQPFTFGKTKKFFTNCCSRTYLQVVANQLALLQIPISYLLQNNYEIDRLLTLTEQLVQICPHSNWLSLLIKNSCIDKYPCEQFDQNKMKIVTGSLNILQKQAAFVQDWSTIIQFLSQLRLALLDQKKVTEGRSLNQKISVPVIQRILMEIAIKADKHFGKLVVAILVKAKEQIQKQNIFMAQKFFQIVDNNPKKFMHVVEDLLPFLEGFTKLLTLASPEICISVADMLKQSFAKLLKIPKTNDVWINGPEAEFWKLFQNLTYHSTKDVKDFVVNCMTMAVLHHYQLGYKSWIALFRFMKQTAKDYRQQIFTIIEKIVTEKLKNCEQFYPDLIDLCLQLVHQSEYKISVEALHALKHTIEIVTQIKIGGVKGEQQQEQRAAKEVTSLIIRVQENLIDHIFSSCHQEVMNTIFRLLGSKTASSQLILSVEDIAQLIGALFSKIEDYSSQILQISEKTINFALNWSVTNHYSPIIQFFTGLVINKYNELSLSAIKCIKTYLQMVNPRSIQEWEPVQNALLSIARNCRISSIINLDIPNKFENYDQEVEPEDGLVRVDLNLFANKMVVQKIIVEILPNHKECLQEVSTLYNQVVKFNDNPYLRCLLWRAGLGNAQSYRPPNLLSLQDTVSGKMVSIYNSIKDPVIIDFSLSIFKRFCKASQLFIELNERILKQGVDARNQNIDLLKDYLQSRKVPLTRVMSYFLPKYPRICKSQQLKKEVVLRLVQSLKYVTNRQPYLKCIKELTKRQS